MKIAFFEIKDWEKSYLKRKLKGHFLELRKEPLSLKNAPTVEDFDIISVFIYSKIDKQVIRKLRKLKLIATRSTGFDHIDLKECQKKKDCRLQCPFLWRKYCG
jgi:D-lactate dehydrogenase